MPRLPACLPFSYPYLAACPPGQILMFRQVRGANFTKAAFEGSTHYALEGRWLAMQLMEIYPWLKIGERGAGPPGSSNSSSSRCAGRLLTGA